MKKSIITTLVTSAGLLGATMSFAGGNLDTFNFTSPGGTIGDDNIVGIVPIRWDPRCSSIEYTLDTIAPNVGTDQEISIEDTRVELQIALDQWNQIPTSFIEMNITQVRTIDNGLIGFDFINELTFETAEDFTALASSPSVSLEEDTEFLVGDDIDGDGDSDVFDPDDAGRNTCFDFDGDGDIEFPAGFYAAGTILDNDVQFSATVMWSTEAASDDTADIQAVAVHEFGHSHGLSHTAINQISDTDGSGSTMFPAIDIGDADSETLNRSLHEDDIAWSSFTYPEGSQDSGIGALQNGDIDFNRDYAVLTGEATTIDGLGLVGASVFAESTNRQRGRAVTAVTGTAIALEFPDGSINLAPPEIGAVNGNYQLPLLRDNYTLGIQALDGSPVAGNQVSLVGVIGGLYGFQNFSNEFLSTRNLETDNEFEPGRGQNIPALPNRPFSDLNFTVNDDVALTAYEDVDFIGTGRVIGQSDVIYAVRFSNASVIEQLESGATLTTATVNTTAIDASIVPTFANAQLTTGRLLADGTIADINTNFSFRQTNGGFIGDSGDDTPIYFNGGRGLSGRLLNELRRDETLDLFYVVTSQNNFLTGPSGVPPLVGVDVDGPFGDSFLSMNGGNFELVDDLNFGIQLLFTPNEN